MRNAVLDLLKYVYRHGYKVAVMDDWGIFKFEETHDGPMKAWDEINAYDGGEEFGVFDETGKRVSIVCPAIGYGNQPDEWVADFTCSRDEPNIVEQWFEEFMN